MAAEGFRVVPRWLTSSRLHPATLVFALLLLAFVLTYGWMAWAGNRAFMPILRDNEVAMWHTVMKHALHGALPLFLSPYSGTWTHYFAADHFNPLLFVLAPLWALLPSNVLFAWVQIAVYGGTAILLFAVARTRLESAGWAAVIAGAFLLSPVPTWSLHNHFSAAPFLILFLPWAVWALLRDKPGWYWVAISGLLLSREDAALLAVVIGLYAALAHRRYRLGGATVALAVAYFVLVTGVVLPALAGGLPYPYTGRGYAWLGPTPGAALERLLTEPLWALQELHARGAFRGLLLHLLPFAFTPLASWRGLLFLLPLSYLLLHPHSTGLAYHHSYWMAALSALAAVEGVRQLRAGLFLRLRGWGGEAMPAGAMGVLAVGIHVLAGYSPVSRAFDPREFTAGPRERAMQAAFALVPPDSRVAASRIYITHLAPAHDLDCLWERVEIRQGIDSAGFWCRDWNRPVESEYLLIVDPRDSPEVRQLLASERYGAIFLQHDVVLLRRGAPTAMNEALTQRVFRVRQARELPREVGEVVFDERAVAGFAVKAPQGAEGLVLYGWYRWLCPGRYEATLRARAPGAAGDLGRFEVVTDAGTTLVADREIRSAHPSRGHYGALALPFELRTRREVEVRVHTTGLATLWIDEVSILPLDHQRAGLGAAEDEAC